ncbi:MAG: hypothetical protein K1W14_05505 [Muribaculaceae bacterium]
MKTGRIIAHSIAVVFILMTAASIVGVYLISTPARTRTYLYESECADLYYEKQGAFGTSATLEIYNETGAIDEKIGLRSEDVKPQLDSIVGKDVYVSYQDFPSADTILKFEKVVLRDALFRQGSLKYRYHFRNIKGGKL